MPPCGCGSWTQVGNCSACAYRLIGVLLLPSGTSISAVLLRDAGSPCRSRAASWRCMSLARFMTEQRRTQKWVFCIPPYALHSIFKVRYIVTSSVQATCPKDHDIPAPTVLVVPFPRHTLLKSATQVRRFLRSNAG